MSKEINKLTARAERLVDRMKRILSYPDRPKYKGSLAKELERREAELKYIKLRIESLQGG